MFKELDPLLHSQLRLAVVSILVSVEEADFVFLREKTSATAGNLSVQLEKLSEAGYISIEKGFSGKRPFGNSGWTFDLFNALATGGFIDLGEADEDGYFDATHEQDVAAEQYVHDLIDTAFFGVKQP